MVGNHPSVKGGITSVISQMRSYDWEQENVSMKFVPTYIEKNNIIKISFFMLAYIKIFFNFILWKPDIIHIHMSYKGSFDRTYLIHQLCRQFHISEVVHLHGSEFKKWYEECSNEKKKQIRNLLKEVDKFVVLGNEWKRRVEEIEPLTSIVVVNNTVSIPNKTVKWNKDEFHIIFLGVLIKRKGVSDLLKAMDLLNKKKLLSKVRVSIAGTGVEETLLKKQCESLGLKDYVAFHGWTDGKRKEELLLESQLFVLPSYNEGLPMAILESMSYGLPVVSTYVGDLREAVDNGENGCLVEAGDINALADALEFMIKLTEEEWGRISINSRRKAEDKFSDKNYKSLFSNLYKELIS